jgi:hypothetical protein
MNVPYNFYGLRDKRKGTMFVQFRAYILNSLTMVLPIDLGHNKEGTRWALAPDAFYLGAQNKFHLCLYCHPLAISVYVQLIKLNMIQKFYDIMCLRNQKTLKSLL